MFNLLYQKEEDMMLGLLNTRSSISSTYRKLSSDANFKRYLKESVNYAKSGGSRDAMGFNSWYFVTKENERVMRIVNLLMHSTLKSFIEKSGEQLSKPCSVFPDSGGSTLMRIMGFLPLLKLVSEHINFSKFTNQHIPDVERASMLEHQRDFLFSKRSFVRGSQYPNDDQFVNYGLRNEYIKYLKEENTPNIKDLCEKMKLLSSAFEDNPTLLNDNALSYGISFWDASRENKETRAKKTSELFSGLIENFSKSIKDAQESEIFCEKIDPLTTVGQIVAFESTKTEVPSDDLNINSFTKMPLIGEYILSKDYEYAYQVLRHQKAEACGSNLTVLFVSEKIKIRKNNAFGDEGSGINVHNQKCTSHCVDIYYLNRPMGYSLNANLL